MPDDPLPERLAEHGIDPDTFDPATIDVSDSATEFVQRLVDRVPALRPSYEEHVAGYDAHQAGYGIGRELGPRLSEGYRQ